MKATLCALRKFAAFIFFITPLFLLSPTLGAESNPADPNPELLRHVRSIEERLTKIEAKQQEIIDRQEKTLAAVDNVRVWATRR